MILNSEYISRTRTIAALAVTMIVYGQIANAAAPIPAFTERLSVQLTEDVVVARHELRLADIATIGCRNPQQQMKASRLDIGEFDDPTMPLYISAEFVRIRLILAGWSSDELEITGASKVTAHYREAKLLTDADIEVAAFQALVAVNETSSENLQVRLVQQFMPTLPPGIRGKNGLRVEVVSPAVHTIGQITMTIQLWDGNDMVSSRPARFEVFRRFRVAVTRVSLQRDQPLTSDALQFEERFLSQSADEPTDEMLIGRRVRSEIKAGTILSVRDLKMEAPTTPNVVIRRRDNVRVVARSGRIQVTLQTAEAQQDGRPGDLIRLKNVQTGQVISGRVMAAGYVEINAR